MILRRTLKGILAVIVLVLAAHVSDRLPALFSGSGPPAFSIPGAHASEDPLSPEEREWLTRHDGRITLAVETGYAPFAFVDDHGLATGLATEYVRLIQKKLGFRVKEIRFETLNDILAAARKKQVDIVNAVTQTPGRSEFLLFSNPFIEIPNVLVMRKDPPGTPTFPDIKSMKISLVDHYAVTEHLLSQYPGLDIDRVPDDLTALLSVSFRRTDAAVIDLATASFLAEQKGMTNLRIAGEVGYDIKLAIACRNDWPMLNRILSKGLEAVSQAEKTAIREKWINFGRINPWETREFWMIIGIGGSVFLMILAGVAVWNRSLTGQVAQRTRQLEQELKDRSEAEKERGKLRLQLSSALEMAHLGHWEYDVKKDEFLFNDYFYKVFRTSVREIGSYILTASEYARRFVHPEDAHMVEEETRKAVETTDPHFSRQLEHRIVFPDGAIGHISVRFFILKDDNGRTVKTYGVNQDITDRKQAEFRLQQAQKMESIGNLAGGIAHDFNNILFPIVGMAELLMDDLPPGTPEHENAREILKAGLRGSELVKQILAFSRQSDHKLIPVPIQKILKEAIGLTRATIPANIEIIQDIQDDCPRVLADPTQVHQIAMNLITNAFHAIEPRAGRIHVELKEDRFPADGLIQDKKGSHPAVRLSVADTGHGIGPEILGRIFDPYFTTKEQGKGTGLGLSVVQGIVKAHKGEIKVDSSPGSGSVFHVFLPLMESLTRQTPSAAIAGRHPTGNERILLVDDEAVIARLETQMLERLGYRVTSCTDSIEAATLFKNSPRTFDLVLSDMTMPHMTGDELAGELTAVRPEIPVIICTGFSERIHPDTIKTKGIKALLMKPVMLSDLADTVRRVLDESR